jgi:hypothetical protein
MFLFCSKQPSGFEPHTAGRSNEKGLFLSWQHPTSRRHAILEEHDGSFWLYLTPPKSLKPERGCPAFTTKIQVETVDWKAIEQTGAPPPISMDVASKTCLIQQPLPEDFNVTSSSNGASIGLVHQGKIIAMIVAGEKSGHSRAIAKEGPLGLPFDDALAARTFQAPSTR